MSFLARASLYLSDHTDAELVALWSLPRTDRLQPISLGTLQGYLLAQDLDQMLDAAATDASLPALLQSGARRIGKMFASTQLHNLDYQDDEIRGQVIAVLTGMVQAGKMTADQLSAIKALGGGDPYTWASEDGLGTDAAHFAAARTAKARLDAIAANRPAVDAKLQTWEVAEVAKVTAWAAAGFADELAAGAEFAL